MSPSGQPYPGFLDNSIKKYDMDELEGLECPERAENIINGKIGNFYIENISNFFSQLRKKKFFFALTKF